MRYLLDTGAPHSIVSPNSSFKWPSKTIRILDPASVESSQHLLGSAMMKNGALPGYGFSRAVNGGVDKGFSP
jgi:hypothetical protein